MNRQKIVKKNNNKKSDRANKLNEKNLVSAGNKETVAGGLLTRLDYLLCY